jgi:hypothetical protein
LLILLYFDTLNYMEKETTKPQTPVTFSPANILLFVILGLVTIAGLVFVGIQIGKSQISNKPTAAQKIVEQPKKTADLEENKVINAGLYIPTINDKYSDTWTAYINWEYNFSFLFPAKWQIDLSDDHMQVRGLTCRGCAGGFLGVGVIYEQNENKLPINEYISKLHSDGTISSELELYKTKNTNLTVYVDRQTPGAGSGQTAFIANNKGTDVVELYCGNCSDTEMNNIISSFDFEVERDQKASWTSFQ